jgi:hypothetical protein
MSGCHRCGGSGVFTWWTKERTPRQCSGPCFACVGGGEFPTWRERQERRQERTQFDETTTVRRD